MLQCYFKRSLTYSFLFFFRLFLLVFLFSSFKYIYFIRNCNFITSSALVTFITFDFLWARRQTQSHRHSNNNIRHSHTPNDRKRRKTNRNFMCTKKVFLRFIWGRLFINLSSKMVCVGAKAIQNTMTRYSFKTKFMWMFMQYT